MIIFGIGINKFFNLNNNTVNQVKPIYIFLLQAGIISTIFLSYIFRISLKNYNWKISFKLVGIILVVYLANKLVLNIFVLKNNTFPIKNLLSLSFVANFVLSTLYHCL